MRPSTFDFLSNLDTLLAVLLGAVLATSGALLAELVQERLNRKRFERDAARFFGYILMSIDQVLDFAFRSQTIGDKWGGTSMQLYKTALREAEIYERNRERLFDIQDMKLRRRIHTHFLTETFPIEAMIEASTNIETLKGKLNGDINMTKKQTADLKSDLIKLQAARETGLEALIREHAKTDALCKEIEKVAKIKFDSWLDDNQPPVTVAGSQSTSDNV